MVFLAIFLTCMFLTPTYAQGLRLHGVVVAEKGIYRADASVVESATGVRRVRNAKLVQATTDIPARLGVRFGLRFALQGVPIGAPAKLELVTRFPRQGLVQHPGGVVFEHRYVVEVNVGVPQYRDFQFDEHYELVTGRWVFEFWHSGRKIGEQRFCVYDTDSGRGCGDELSLAVVCFEQAIAR